MKKPIFIKTSFHFDQGTVSWMPNNEGKTNSNGEPFMWTVWAGNNSKWFTWLNPNRTNALHFLRKHYEKNKAITKWA